MDILFRLNDYFFEAVDKHISAKLIFAMFVLLFVINTALFNHQGSTMLVNEQFILMTILAIITLLLTTYLMTMLIVSILKILIENRFYKYLKLAILNTSINNLENIKSLMKPHNVNDQQVIRVMYKLYQNAMIGKEQALSKDKILLESLLTQFEEQASLINIPSTLSYTLNKVRPQIDKLDMRFLINQLQDVFNNDKRKMQKQYILTILGFVISIFGILNAIYKPF